MSKKVIIVIVEGDSDEELLMNRLREIYRDKEIRFESQNKDIFYDYKSTKPIKAVIGDVVKGIIKKRKYKSNDILAIIHIMDTDGCFIPEKNVIINSSQNKLTLYDIDNISVLDERQRLNIIERNNKRKSNVKLMNNLQTIIGSNYKYQLYFFSRNLEHVIFDDANPINDLKCDNVEKFIEDLKVPIEDYLSKYLPNTAFTEYIDKYRDSWNLIEIGTNSLKRYTNIPLLIEFINSILI